MEMKKLLEDLGYSVDVEENLTARQTMGNSGSETVQHLWESCLHSHLRTWRMQFARHTREGLHCFLLFNLTYTSFGDNVSRRDSTRGSIFITQLIACFQRYSWRCHLEEVFWKVQQAFESPEATVQMPTIERVSMTRYFYLFPGN
nr:caspase-12-like [Pan paniscus]XP_034789498.1 caspase-12-like [Pan paniscus]